MSKQKQTDTEVHLREPESAFFLSTKQNECVKTRPHVLLCVRQKQQQFWFLPWWAVIWGSRPGSGCKAPPSCPWQTSRRLSGRVYCFLPRRRLLTRCPEDEPLPVGEKNQRGELRRGRIRISQAGEKSVSLNQKAETRSEFLINKQKLGLIFL